MKGIGIAVAVASGVVGVAWYAEAVTCGRCFVSSYLAPFAILGNFVALALLARSRRARD
jgi:hypothetical protein